jgi:aminopeptidase YwaD
MEGFQWYQGDHMLFVQAGRPAVAVTSEKAMELLTKITHTPRDTSDGVECRKLVETAEGLKALVVAL